MKRFNFFSTKLFILRLLRQKNYFISTKPPHLAGDRKKRYSIFLWIKGVFSFFTKASLVKRISSLLVFMLTLAINIVLLYGIVHFSTLSNFERYYQRNVILGHFSLQRLYTPTFPTNLLSLFKDTNSLGNAHQHDDASASGHGPLKVLEYQVQSGDNYWDIAKKTGISLDTILSFNRIDQAHNARVKQIIKIPQRNGILHERKEGETIASLAKLYSTSENKIIFFNPNINTKQIFVPDASFNLSQRMKMLGNEFFKPVDSIRLTGFFGYRRHPITFKRSFHRGIDFAGPIGMPVYAARAGRVIYTGMRSGYGLTIVLSHGNSIRSLYAHLSEIKVKMGQVVGNRQRIGSLGNTGRSTGPHLHFEVIKNNRHVNPLPITELFK